ncbi:MAG TPA: GDSL-type esterase/lipase family protein [Nocardioidaceae bacterium]|nr:GDSL-type esterase/lipase family protein [Nocardioidaceae bacterium]
MTRRRSTAVALAAVLLLGAGSTLGARLVLHRQARVARRLIGKPLGEDAHRSDKTYKKKYGDRIDLLLLGDSIAAGLGADSAKQTLGAQLSRRLARSTLRAVRLHTAAQVGAETSMLRSQLAGLPTGYRPDVAVIVVGGNDVTHRVKVSDSVEHLAEAVSALRGRGRGGTVPGPGRTERRTAAVAVSRRPRVASAGDRPAECSDRAGCACGVAGRRGRAVLREPTGRDVRRRPLPPIELGLPAHGQGDAAESARGAGVRRRLAARLLPTG